MMRPLNDRHRIEMMLEMIQQIESYAYYGYFQDFSIDKTMVLAMLKRLEIIGEAAHWLSPELKSVHTQIDWENIAGLRHSLVDEYHEINAKTIWREMTRSMPSLKTKLEKILSELPDEPSGTSTEV